MIPNGSRCSTRWRRPWRPPFASLAHGIRTDRAAVDAALTTSWSNGQVEGQVHRLKLVKRQGYGRAKLDLLARRVRAA